MISTVYSAVMQGISSIPLSIEVDVSNRGLPGITIAGLQGSSIRSLRERIKTAIHNTNIRLPAKKVTVNIRPGLTTKDPTIYDLPITLALLSAFQVIPAIPKNLFGFGELSLDGNLQSTPGCIAHLYDLSNKEKILFMPQKNLDMLTYTNHSHVVLVQSLGHAIELLKQPQTAWPFVKKSTVIPPASPYPDISQVFGQASIKRVLTIAVAGRHHILLTGVPGVGKTLLMCAFPGLFPSLSNQEIGEVIRVYGSARISDLLALPHPPCRQPMHTATIRQMFGGVQPFSPGEISLAHHGVLLLDELHQWKTKVLENLRQPMEEHVIHLPSENGGITMPADCVVLAATNSCPCGYYGSEKHTCTCTINQRSTYREKLSGAFLDRFDLQIFVPEISSADVHTQQTQESPGIRERIAQMRKQQIERTAPLPYTKDATRLAEKALDMGTITPRGYFSVLRIARTIAELDNAQEITPQHIAEALQYRTTPKT